MTQVPNPEPRADAAQKLRQAANLIREAEQVLNTAEHQCEHCGLNRAESWDDTRIYQMLDNLPAKLWRIARWMQSGTPPDEMDSPVRVMPAKEGR